MNKAETVMIILPLLLSFHKYNIQVQRFFFVIFTTSLMREKLYNDRCRIVAIFRHLLILLFLLPTLNLLKYMHMHLKQSISHLIQKHHDKSSFADNLSKILYSKVKSVKCLFVLYIFYPVQKFLSVYCFFSSSKVLLQFPF